MQLWEKILQAAIVGSERTHFEPAVQDALRQYGIDPEDLPPRVILSGAATLYPLRKLQLPLEAFETPLPEPAPEEDDAQQLPPKSLGQLQKILTGTYRRALPEFVQLLKQRNWIIPPEFLPRLLEDSRKDPELWTAIRPLMGLRAAWLIAQHPDWRTLLPQTDPADWPKAHMEERQLIVAQLRQTMPELALPLLESIWEDLHYRQKVDFLRLLAVGLSPADEPFLESCREDSRKEVRIEATELLLRLPESRLLQSLFDYLLPYFQLRKKGKTLDIILPDEIPEEALLEGLISGKKQGKSKSLKLHWVMESAARIPPAFWQKEFKWDSTSLVENFSQSNFPAELVPALARSAIRFQDRDLSLALVRRLVLLQIPFPEGMDWQAVVRLISSSDMQNLVEDYLQQQPGLLEEKAPITQILELGLHPWSKLTAQRIIEGLKQWMAESKTFLWNLWHYKRLLETAGYCSPVELFDTFNADWPMQSPVWNQWAQDVDRMLRIMRFRKSMYASKT